MLPHPDVKSALICSHFHLAAHSKHYITRLTCNSHWNCGFLCIYLLYRWDYPVYSIFNVLNIRQEQNQINQYDRFDQLI